MGLFPAPWSSQHPVRRTLPSVHLFAGALILFAVVAAIAAIAPQQIADTVERAPRLAETLSQPSAASATALTTPSRLWPWAVPSDVIAACSQGCSLTLGGPASAPNALRPIRFPNAHGVVQYRGFVLNSYSGTVPSGTSTQWSVAIEPGDMSSPTRADLQRLFAWDAQKLCRGGQTSCASSYAAPSASTDQPLTADGTVCTTDPRCPRVGFVGVIQPASSASQGNMVTVTGFSCLYVMDTRLDRGILSISARTPSSCAVP